MAQLISDDSHIPIRFAIFNGTNKAFTMYSVREFGNTCLLFSLDKVLEYGEVLNVPQADECGRKVERKEVSLFDEEAFREAIINAFVHNQWTTGNAPIISVFSDRIEILSRGTIPPGQTIEGFYAGESVPVNQKLSNMFLQLHISERTGRGVPKITEKYGKGTYEFRENSIMVSIPITRVEKNEMTPDNRELPLDKMENSLNAIIPDRNKKSPEQILEFCVLPRNILEIAVFGGLKEKKSVRRHIRPLIDQGRLAMTLPDKPNSKNQKYITIK